MDLEPSLQLLQELTRRQREEIHLLLNEQFYVSDGCDWQKVPAELTLEDLYRCAVAVLGGPATALDWLTCPNPELNNEPPLLASDRSYVIAELGRIENGVSLKTFMSLEYKLAELQ
ncbi:MAG: DUF2384 domain-containing protein, partial [Verrucomicrobia bacterium]|nr:DUF2384 domain-containing protein [Verrucomicrobiota bacterium]